MIDRRRAWLLLISLAATFVIVRAALSFRPNADFTVGGYNIHHLFTGVLLVTLCSIPLVLSNAKSRMADAAKIGFGIGLSLVLDEWVYLIATDGSNASYLLRVSWVGGAFMVGLACCYVGVLLAFGKRAKRSD